jgi:hypothetical protein
MAPCVVEPVRRDGYTVDGPQGGLLMVGLGVTSDAGAASGDRLEAEIANEPQWVVFGNAVEEDAWAAEELAEIAFVVGWAAARR